MGGVHYLWFRRFMILSIVINARSFGEDFECVYTVYARTRGIRKSGTDSNIILTLFDYNSYGIRISNLEVWGGQMGRGYNYFERGHLDIFIGRAPCLPGSICSMNITSDGSSPRHAWFCDFVEVTASGPDRPCSQMLFKVNRWLANDTSPYQLTAIKDFCGGSNGAAKALDGSSTIVVPDAHIVSVI